MKKFIKKPVAAVVSASSTAWSWVRRNPAKSATAVSVGCAAGAIAATTVTVGVAGASGPALAVGAAVAGGVAVVTLGAFSIAGLGLSAVVGFVGGSGVFGSVSTLALAAAAGFESGVLAGLAALGIVASTTPAWAVATAAVLGTAAVVSGGVALYYGYRYLTAAPAGPEPTMTVTFG